jgi:ketopantoate hydroxymethyltransferase
MNPHDLDNALKIQSKTFTNSENILFLSVIYQALLDVTASEIEDQVTSITAIRREATNWFFASIGVTSENFEFVCDYAGLKPSRVREFAAYVVNSDTQDEARKKLNLIWKGTKDV